MAKPVVATRLPLVERTFPAGSVATYEAGDAASMADAILRIVDEPLEREARVVKTAERVDDRSWTRESERYLRLVERLIASRATGGADPDGAIAPRILPAVPSWPATDAVDLPATVRIRRRRGVCWPAVSPQQDSRLAIVGLGYVGLPLALSFVEAGLDVVGVDASQARVDELLTGRSPIDDIGDAQLRAALERGFRVVHTSQVRSRRRGRALRLRPDADQPGQGPGPRRRCCRPRDLVREHLRAGQLVVLQSTTFPGTTSGPFREELERSGLVAGRDFDLAFAPERVNPGDPASHRRDVPRLVGGLTPTGTARAAALLRRINSTVHELSSPDAAELAKLLENVFRNVNIALVNQLALLCERMGLDVWEVVDAAATKPFGFMPFRPGPGVGGHCIPVDPYYLSLARPPVRFRGPVRGGRRRHQPRDAPPRRRPRRGGAQRAGSGGQGRPRRCDRRRVQAERPRPAQLAGGGRDGPPGGARRGRRLPRPARGRVPGCSRNQRRLTRAPGPR